MNDSLKKVIDVLGEEVVLGFSKALYDIIISEISQTKSENDIQPYLGEDLLNNESDEDDGISSGCGIPSNYNIPFIKKFKNGRKLVIKKATTHDDIISLSINESNNIYTYIININIFGCDDNNDSQDQAKGLSLIINYGIDKLKKSILDNIIQKLEGIVNDRWLFTLEKMDMSIKLISIHDFNYFPIVFDLQFKVIDEVSIRPGGKEYLQLKEITKIGKF